MPHAARQPRSWLIFDVSHKKTMYKQILLLRISYWAGAIFDGAMLIPMLFPEIAGAMFGIDHFNPARDYRYAMMIGASLMLGWTVLLLWADRKPIQRKGVILITAVPVVIGLILAGAYAVSTGLIRAERMTPTWAIQAILLFMFFYSYFSVSHKNESSANKAPEPTTMAVTPRATSRISE